MKLFFRKYGTGRPLIILHGLFGQSDNWNTLARQFAEQGLEVYAADQRNHGLSPWSDEWNYKVMAEDVLELIRENGLSHAIVLGHSMGGKTAMQLALDHPSEVSALIVADIALRKYEGTNDAALKGLLSVDLSKISSRKEAEEQLSAHVPDFGTKQFLLKNLYRKDEGTYGWRFNLAVIAAHYERSGEAVGTEGKQYPGPALFIRGSRSQYITDDDFTEAKKVFPSARLATVEGAGHWVHADKPKEFFEEVLHFIHTDRGD
jgi:pimeloyl-ACP methyl ester carboxylesterase